MTKGYSSEGEFDITDVVEFMQIKPANRIIDIGCGYGYFAIHISNIFSKQIKVFGLDTNDELIKQTKTKDVNFIHGSILEKTPFQSNYFDKIIMVNLFHGMFFRGEIKPAFLEIQRLIKNSGSLYIIDIREDSNRNNPKQNIRNNPLKINNLISGYNFILSGKTILNKDYFIAEFKVSK